MSVWSWIASKFRKPEVKQEELPPSSPPPPSSTPTPPPSPTPTPTPTPTSGGSSGGGGGSGGGSSSNFYTSSGQEGYDILTKGVDTSQSTGSEGAKLFTGGSVNRLSGGGVTKIPEPPPEKDKKKFTGSVIEPAISTGEQYRLAREERGNIQGTLWFAGQKASGWISSSNLSPFKDSGYQAPIGKLVAYSTETAPYFVPVVGPSLLVGTGIEAVGTKAGRGRISTTSETLKTNYNIPTYVSTPVQYGLYTGGAILGAASLSKSASAALNLPRTNVKLGRITQTAEEGKIITRADYQADTKTLFGTRTRYGQVGTTTAYKTGKDGEIIIGRSNTFSTSYKPSNLNLPKGETRIGDIRGSQSFTKSFTREDIILESVKGPKISGVLEEYEGFSSKFAGKGAYGKPKQLFGPKPNKFKFVGEGGSYNVGENTNIYGRSYLVEDGKILKAGSTFYEGTLIKPDISSNNVVRSLSPSGNIKRTPLSATFTNEAQKLASGVTTPPSRSFPTPKIGGPTTINFPQTNIKTSPIQITSTETKTTSLDSSKSGTIPTLDVVTNERIKGGGRSSAYLTPPNTIFKPTTKIVDTVRTPIPIPSPTILKTPTRLKGGSPTSTPIFGPKAPFIPPFSFPIIGGGSFLKGVGKVPSKQTFRYTPSYTALIFGIKGKRTKPTLKGKYTGFEVRPVTKGWAKLLGGIR